MEHIVHAGMKIGSTLRHFKIFDCLEINTQIEITNLIHKISIYVKQQKLEMYQLSLDLITISSCPSHLNVTPCIHF